MSSKFNSIIQILDYFKDEETCKRYLIDQRWNGAPYCPHCGCNKVYVTNRGFKCADKICKKKFTVTTGTVMENTKISLRYWMAAIYLGTAHTKGISALQLVAVAQLERWILTDNFFMFIL